MKKAVRLLRLLFVPALSLACTLSPVVTPPPTRTPSPTIRLPARTPIAPTATLRPTPTPEPATLAPPTPTLPAPVFTAEVRAERINLRSGPSTLHTVAGTLTKGNHVSVLGKAPGIDWVLVETSQGKTGWLSVKFLLLHGDLNRLEDVAVRSSYFIEGRVMDSKGTPINGVSLAIYQGEGAGQLRTEATSGADGRFYAYLPLGARGAWMVEVTGVSCKSWIMDSGCRYHGRFSSNGKETIEPPLGAPLYFVFEPQSP